MKYYKNYFYSIRFFILFSFLFFVFAAFCGYFSAKTSPEEAKLILENLKKMYGSVLEMNALHQFFFIFLNNGFMLFLILVLGIIFGIFPFLVLFSNGGLLGILAFLSKDTLSWPKFFLGTMPHGIIEIPVMILACAIGMKIGKTVFKKTFKKEGSIKAELFLAFKIFLKILLPLLALSAAIEIFITAKLFGL